METTQVLFRSKVTTGCHLEMHDAIWNAEIKEGLRLSKDAITHHFSSPVSLTNVTCIAG